MTAPLAGALVLSALTGVSVSWVFSAWPRLISAEAWIVHRRSFQRAHDTTRQFGGLSILRTGSVAGLRILPEADVALLSLASPDAPGTQGDAIRRLALLAGGSAVAVMIVPSIGVLATGAQCVAVSPALFALAPGVCARNA